MNIINKTKKTNFIYKVIDNDIKLKKYNIIRTRFPPEPNGYLHIGHAKSICLNFGIANFYNGECNLRFDDTNPLKEDIKYINAIKEDILWLGFNWNKPICYASDYFDIMFNYALELIKKGLSYVDKLSLLDIKYYRGNLYNTGINSPYRNTSIEENIKLFFDMRDGKFKEGSVCLRAKINMKSHYMIMRDPVLYRIKFCKHHQTNNKWCIYPTYDFAHCISDSIEGITHSLCTLEFQDNRRLYEWILNNITIKHKPCQYEFSKLNIKNNILSKRKLNILIKKKIINNLDDPRLLTISGLRRRGYTSKSIRSFCNKIGLTRQNSYIEMSLLESCIRKELNNNSLRVMAVLDPLLVIINNLPKNHCEKILMLNHPKNYKLGFREVFFTKKIYIDQSDFKEVYNKGYRRLVLGGEVRLRNSYIIKAESIKKNHKGEIIKIICSYDSNTLNKKTTNNRVIKGVIHWVSATKGIKSEFRIYNSLFNKNNNIKNNFCSKDINKNSLIIKKGFIEENILIKNHNYPFQFEREGYFFADIYDSSISNLVFNKVVSLKNHYNIKK